MVSEFPRARVVDAVWSAGRDGRWHTPSSLAKRVPFEPQEIEAALGFLERYGFAHSSPIGERRFKMIVGGPSPTEAVDVMLLVGLRDDRALPRGS
jgi:hypothetical protein